MYGFLEEGSISKVIANTLYVDPGGAWLLPYWRENAPTQTGIGCNLQPRLTGVPGVLISTDMVSALLMHSILNCQCTLGIVISHQIHPSVCSQVYRPLPQTRNSVHNQSHESMQTFDDVECFVFFVNFLQFFRHTDLIVGQDLEGVRDHHTRQQPTLELDD